MAAVAYSPLAGCQPPCPHRETVTLVTVPFSHTTPQSAGRVLAKEVPRQRNFWAADHKWPQFRSNQAIKGVPTGDPLRWFSPEQRACNWILFPWVDTLSKETSKDWVPSPSLVEDYFFWIPLSEPSPPLGGRSYFPGTFEWEFSPFWVNVCTICITILPCCHVAITSRTGIPNL